MINSIIQGFRNLFDNITKLSNLGLSILGSTIIALIILALVFIGYPEEYSTLYSGLELADSSQIVQELEEKKIPYKLLYDGSSIMVPKKQALSLRMKMAQKGLPGRTSIVGYEIFDKDEALGTTSFAQNIKMLRALEGELSRTISSLEPIHKARVHLVMPKRELFSQSKEEPRATVILNMKNHYSLNKREVEAIGYLVLTSIPGLELKNITILDSKGQSLKLGAENEQLGNAISSHHEYKTAYENRLSSNIEEMLEKSFGKGNVKAQVAVSMNFDKIVTNSEIFDPERMATRSSHTIVERETSQGAESQESDVSVLNNIPDGAENSSYSNKGNDKNKSDEIINYEISKIIKNQISQVGTIENISVAVLVDGKHTLDQNGGKIYVARSEDELNNIKSIVKGIIGFNEERNDKIEVLNLPFNENDTDTLLANDENSEMRYRLVHLIIVATSIVLGILGLGIFVIKPIFNSLQKSQDKQTNADSLKLSEEELVKTLDSGRKFIQEAQTGINQKLSKIDKAIQDKLDHVVAIFRQLYIKDDKKNDSNKGK